MPATGSAFSTLTCGCSARFASPRRQCMLPPGQLRRSSFMIFQPWFRVLTCAVALAAATPLMAQQPPASPPAGLAGAWEGKLEAGITLRIVFHFDKGADGKYTAKMDSPDQGANGIPVE